MSALPTLTERERAQLTRANASGQIPVVFIHGLWLLAGSWERWARLFEEAGFVALTPGWPGDPETVAEANANPSALANKGIREVADHLDGFIQALQKRPALIGHSFGGMLAQHLAGRGRAFATVAIDPAPFRSVLPLPPAMLKAAWPAIGNPANRSRAVALSFEQFRYGFANAVSEDEARALHQTYAVPAPAKPLFQAAFANLNPWTEDQVDTRHPERGPLLIVSGDQDHAVPRSVAHAAFKLQRRSPGVTELVDFDRGHALVIDGGWREVADAALAFVKRFA